MNFWMDCGWILMDFDGDFYGGLDGVWMILDGSWCLF